MFHYMWLTMLPLNLHTVVGDGVVPLTAVVSFAFFGALRCAQIMAGGLVVNRGCRAGRSLSLCIPQAPGQLPLICTNIRRFICHS